MKTPAAGHRRTPHQSASSACAAAWVFACAVAWVFVWQVPSTANFISTFCRHDVISLKVPSEIFHDLGYTFHRFLVILECFWPSGGHLGSNGHPDPQKDQKDKIPHLHFVVIFGSVWSPGGHQNRIEFALFFGRVLWRIFGPFGGL